jgi:hypothetical protein
MQLYSWMDKCSYVQRERDAKGMQASSWIQALSSGRTQRSWYEMTLMDAQGCEETPRSIALWNRC